MSSHSRLLTQAIVAVLFGCLVLVGEAAKLKVEAQPDPTFDFATVHTWAWDAEPGEVIMARTANDDPAPIKARVEPLIRKFFEAEMAKKGLTLASGGAPDVQFHYYVLVTISTSGQYMGQFLPAVSYWGLPPFTAQATSLDIATKGSLVLDAMLPGKAGERKVVWRGIAQSTVEDADSDAVREARIRNATTELAKRFPLKKKK